MSAEKQKPARQNGRFVKGQSGNPGGRPKEYRDVVALARQCTGAAIATLAQIMTDETKREAARVKAAEILLERGWGKAPQKVDVSISSLSDERKLALAKRAIEIEEESRAH